MPDAQEARRFARRRHQRRIQRARVGGLVGLEGFGPEPPGYETAISQDAASRILLRAAETGDAESVRLAPEMGGCFRAPRTIGHPSQ